LTQLCPGTYAFTWDGTANQTSYPPNNIAPTGLYTFDIAVQGACPYDTDKMRSEVVDAKQTCLDVNLDSPDNYKFGYVLESSDGKPASTVTVNVFLNAADNFKLATQITGGTKAIQKGSTPSDSDWNYVGFSQKIIQSGGALETPEIAKFFAVISGFDNNLNNKQHHNKPLLELNSRKNPPTAALFASNDQPSTCLALEGKAAGDLKSGAFRVKGFDSSGKPILSPDPTKFREYWVLKNGSANQKIPIFYFVSTLAYDGLYVWRALSNVDVFTFIGHAWGDAIYLGPYGQFHSVIYTGKPAGIQNIPNKYKADDLDSGALQQLHLAVLGGCSLYGTSVPPLTTALHDKGAQLVLYVTGESRPSGTCILYDSYASLWAKKFFHYAAKGYKSGGSSTTHYYTMLRAAQVACDEIWAFARDAQGMLYYFKPLQVFGVGTTDYLGNINH
jgi:hypothetical protein